MKNNNTKPLSKVICLDESEIRGYLDKLVLGTVEETPMPRSKRRQTRCGLG